MQTLPQSELNSHAASVATPAQLAQLARMTNLGWKVSKAAGYRSADQVIFVTHPPVRGLPGSVACLMPCGKVERRQPNRRTVSVKLPTGRL